MGINVKALGLLRSHNTQAQFLSDSLTEASLPPCEVLYFHPHFSDKEREAWGVSMSCPGLYK